MSDFGRFLNSAASAFASEYSQIRRDRKAREFETKKASRLQKARDKSEDDKAKRQIAKEDRAEARKKRDAAEKREAMRKTLQQIQKAKTFATKSRAINPPRPGGLMTGSLPPGLIPTPGQVKGFASTELTGAGFEGVDKTAEMKRLFPDAFGQQKATKPDRYKVWDEKTGQMQWATRGADGMVRLGLFAGGPEQERAPTKASIMKELYEGGHVTKQAYIDFARSADISVTSETNIKLPSPQVTERYADVRSAIADIDTAMNLMFTPNGTFKWGVVALSKVNWPGAESRKLRAALYNPIDVLMRGRTGAQISASEIRGYAKSYAPEFGDVGEVVEFKLSRLKEIFEIQELLLRPGMSSKQKLKLARGLLDEGITDIATFKKGQNTPQPPFKLPEAPATKAEAAPIKDLFNKD